MIEPGAEGTIWRDGSRGLELVATRTASAGLVGQIAATRFGTQGLRYRRLDVGEHLAALDAPLFLELHRGGALAGTYVLSRARLLAGDATRPGGTAAGGAFEGVYRGLLTVREDLQGRGLGRVLVEQALAWLGHRAARAGGPLVSYGCIERRNTRSRALLGGLGCREIGTLHTLGVYRQWPRRRVSVETLDSPRGDERVDSALAEAHGDCALRGGARTAAPYLALTDDSGVLAGASASVHRIDLGPLTGLLGAMDRHLMRHVPAARRRFDPRAFAYLRLDDVVVRAGHAHLWSPLLATLLAERGLHTAMFVLDPRSRAHALLEQAGLFGRATRLMRQEVTVLASAWNAGDDMLGGIARRPLGLAPMDI